MSERDTKKSGLSLLDTGLIVALAVGVVLVVLWVAHAVLGLVLLAFKVAILVIVVALVVRVAHHLSSRGS